MVLTTWMQKTQWKHWFWLPKLKQHSENTDFDRLNSNKHSENTGFDCLNSKNIVTALVLTA
jgi:hypothetical protein